MIQYIFPPACVIFSFSSASYNFTSLDYSPLWVNSPWHSLCFLDWNLYFLSQIHKVFSYYICKYFSFTFLLSPSGTIYNANDSTLNAVPVVSYCVPIYFCSSLLCTASAISTNLSFILLIHYLCHLILILSKTFTSQFIFVLLLIGFLYIFLNSLIRTLNFSLYSSNNFLNSLNIVQSSP